MSFIKVKRKQPLIQNAIQFTSVEKLKEFFHIRERSNTLYCTPIEELIPTRYYIFDGLGEHQINLFDWIVDNEIMSNEEFQANYKKVK